MSARAALVTEWVPRRGTTRLKGLRSQAPLSLRPIHPKGAEPLFHRARGPARVALAAGAAGPLGGDDFTLEVRVGAGSSLVLNEIAAMLVLPGARGGQSRMRIRIHVGADATFVWLPEPVIAAHACHHDHDVRISLEAGARLVMREEAILGRHGEQPGDFKNLVRVEYAGKPIYHQQLRVGPSAGAWNSAAVVGDSRAVGSVIAVDPVWAGAPPAAAAYHPEAVLAPLPGPGAAISALAADSLGLRRLLHAGLAELGAPWAL